MRTRTSSLVLLLLALVLPLLSACGTEATADSSLDFFTRAENLWDWAADEEQWSNECAVALARIDGAKWLKTLDYEDRLELTAAAGLPEEYVERLRESQRVRRLKTARVIRSSIDRAVVQDIRSGCRR